MSVILKTLNALEKKLPCNWNMHVDQQTSLNSFLTLLIRLQCSDNDFGDVLYEPWAKVDLISVVF